MTLPSEASPPVLGLPRQQALRRFFWFDLPVVTYLSVVFYLGGSPTEELPKMTWELWDKAQHFGAFGLLAWLLYRLIYERRVRLGRWQCLGLGALGSSLVGALLEGYQFLFPNRSPDVWDWVADTLGALTAILGWAWVTWLDGRLRRKSAP